VCVVSGVEFSRSEATLPIGAEWVLTGSSVAEH
jgi:hypothetical protein